MDANPPALRPAELDQPAEFDPQPELASAEPRRGRDVRGLGPLLDVPVRVQAVLGGARMRVDDLLATSAGSVIELDRRVGEPVDLLVNDRLIARGELVLIEGMLGVTLTEIVRVEG